MISSLPSGSLLDLLFDINVITIKWSNISQWQPWYVSFHVFCWASFPFSLETQLLSFWEMFFIFLHWCYLLPSISLFSFSETPNIQILDLLGCSFNFLIISLFSINLLFYSAETFFKIFSKFSTFLLSFSFLPLALSCFLNVPLKIFF